MLPTSINSILLMLMNIINIAVIFSFFSISYKSGPELPPTLPHWFLSAVHFPSRDWVSKKNITQSHRALSNSCLPRKMEKCVPLLGWEEAGFRIRTPELGWHLHHCLARGGAAELPVPLVKWRFISTAAVLRYLHKFSDFIYTMTLRRGSNSFVSWKIIFSR